MLAGGTDLISLMKEYIATPKSVVNIKSIKELRGIAEERLGTSHRRHRHARGTVADAQCPHEYPSYPHRGRSGITSPQIRNMGTVGGDLCQRPRCWYFRNGFGLLAMKDGKSLVPGGENEYHAIFGGGPAYFVSPPASGPPLDRPRRQGQAACRPRASAAVDAAKFFVAPKDENTREIDLKPNEILTENLVPSAAGLKNATYEIRAARGHGLAARRPLPSR